VTLPSKKNSLDWRPPTPLAKGMPGMGDFVKWLVERKAG